MNFNKGDRVKFLNEVGKGTIIALIDNDMVLVLTDDGFEYPVLKKELILTDQPAIPEKKVQSEANYRPEKPPVPSNDIPVNQNLIERKEGPLLVYLGLLPANSNLPAAGNFILHLINDSSFQILFHVGMGSDSSVTTIKAGYLEPDMKIVLADYPLQLLTENNGSLYFQIIAYRNTAFARHEPISAKIKLNTETLKSSASFKKNKFIQGNALILPVEQSDSRKLKMSLDDFKSAMVQDKNIEKISVKPVSQVKSENKKSDFQEVDLHIEQITNKFKTLSPGEIIEIQMARFRTSLAGAILASEKRIVFIHGLGAGKLKSEIRKAVDKEYASCSYQDASFKEYGYGATLIIIK